MLRSRPYVMAIDGPNANRISCTPRDIDNSTYGLCVCVCSRIECGAVSFVSNLVKRCSGKCVTQVVALLVSN